MSALPASTSAFAPLILIGSELAHMDDLKSEALRELKSGIAIYQHRYGTQDLAFFGLHTTEVILSKRETYNLLWHDNHPIRLDSQKRSALIISLGSEYEFLEVVNAVLFHMKWIKDRQKAFAFAEQRSA